MALLQVKATPLGQDHDDDHYGKLIDSQHKNDNDTPPVFP